MDTQTRVTEISIENVFGIKQLAFDPDGVSLVQGDNDTGKTSVLRAILLLLGGGHDEAALRKGAENGEVRFTLDDGTEVWASLTENGTYYKIEGRDDVTARQLLESLQDEISVNPIEILQARPQDRGQILLEAMPMRLDGGLFDRAITPLANTDRPLVDDVNVRADHALKVLGDKSSGAIGTLYEQRQELHGAKRDKQGTVSDLEQSVEQHEEPDEMRSDREKITEQIEIQRKQKEKAVQSVDEWEQQQIAKIREQAKRKRKEAREDYDPTIQDLQAKKERITERIEQAEKAEQTKEIIEQRREELAELEDRYDRLSEAIENLRSLKIDFADDLPGGVRIDDDGEILDADCIRFENWNEERQVRFAARIAEMRAGELALIPIDGIERLVGEQREAFLRRASESDAQYILTEAVAGQDLTVTRRSD